MDKSVVILQPHSLVMQTQAQHKHVTENLATF